MGPVKDVNLCWTCNDIDSCGGEKVVKGKKEKLTVDAMENWKSYLLSCFFVHLPCGAIRPKYSVYIEQKWRWIKIGKQIVIKIFRSNGLKAKHGLGRIA